jgi:AcrR family transcriptional regulator
VGRDALIAAARTLLEELPPALVTISSIARKAGVDPALVRYYFGNREALLLAVVDQMLGEHPQDVADSVDAVTALRDHMRGTFRFTRSARHMNRLMIDELAAARSAEVRDRVYESNARAVRFYADVQERDGGDDLTRFDPLFLHIAAIGVCDFFVTAAPILDALVPPGTDMDDLARRYEAFVTDLLINGLKKRD